MRKLFSRLSFLMLLICLCSSVTVLAQETVVYVVRHAEKATTDPSDRNPQLSNEGKERAQELNKVLKNEKFAGIFSTNYHRTRQTAAPTAERLGLEVAVYPPADFNSLATRIKSDFSGKSVLVVGHSNTVLEIVEALGAKRPLPELSEEDYDYLFKVRINEEGTAEVSTMNLGKKTRKG